MQRLSEDDRGRITYTDVVMAFGTLVTFIAVAPWTYDIIAKIQSTADPLTGTLAALVPPVLLIALLVSIGVSGRSR